MRLCKKNQSKIIGLNYIAKVDVLDSEGYKTGSKAIQYSSEYCFYGHISSANGSTQSQMFGNDVSYTNTIAVNKDDIKKYGITESSVFFIDIEPTYTDEQPNFNYRVKRIAETINEAVIAVEKVKDNADEEEEIGY